MSKRECLGFELRQCNRYLAQDRFPKLQSRSASIALKRSDTYLSIEVDVEYPFDLGLKWRFILPFTVCQISLVTAVPVCTAGDCF